MIRYIIPVIALSLLGTSSAFAYVGPGVGLGVIGTIFGIFAAIALALFGLFWYPIKRAFSKKSTATPAASAGHDATVASTAANDSDASNSTANPESIAAGDAASSSASSTGSDKV